jgi:hypothetical protein
MDAYSKEIRKLEGKFYGIEYSHVVRDKNQATDALSKLGSSRARIIQSSSTAWCFYSRPFHTIN